MQPLAPLVHACDLFMHTRLAIPFCALLYMCVHVRMVQSCRTYRMTAYVSITC